MNTISFNDTESADANEGHHELGSLNDKDIDLSQIKTEIAGEGGNEFYVNTESVKSVLQPFEVFKPTSKDDFGKWETDFLVDYIIKTHHDFAKKKAITIYTLAQKVSYRHGDNHPELLTFIKIMFMFLHDLLNQMSKEEQSIFPYIRQAAKDKRYSKINSGLQSLKEKIKCLQDEHAKIFINLKALRQVTNNYGIPSDACNSYTVLFEIMKELEYDLTIHFYLEDNFLFPNVLQLTECD